MEVQDLLEDHSDGPTAFCTLKTSEWRRETEQDILYRLFGFECHISGEPILIFYPILGQMKWNTPVCLRNCVVHLNLNRSIRFVKSHPTKVLFVEGHSQQWSSPYDSKGKKNMIHSTNPDTNPLPVHLLELKDKRRKLNNLTLGYRPIFRWKFWKPITEALLKM